MDHLNSTRWPDLVIFNKKKKKRKKEKKKRTHRILDLDVPADYWVKLKESEKRDKYLDLARELKKTVQPESDGNTNCDWSAWHSHKKIGTRIRGLGKKEDEWRPSKLQYYWDQPE